MNKSKFINPEKCRSCGKCCKTFSIVYDKELEEKEPVLFSDVKRFKMLDTDLIEVIEEKDLFIVKFKSSCKHLKYENGVYSCDIYNEDRPELCKEYPYEETIDCPEMEGKNARQ